MSWGAPRVTLVRTGYYGILSLLTDFTEVLPVAFLRNATKKSSMGSRALHSRMLLGSCFVYTERRFLVVLRHSIITHGNVTGMRAISQFTAPLPTLRASLVSFVSPLHPVARSSKGGEPVSDAPSFLPRASRSLRRCCHLAFRRPRVSKRRRARTVAGECCSH